MARTGSQPGGSDLRLPDIVDVSPIATGITALDGRFVRVNRACAEFFARTEEEMLGLTWQDLTDGSAREVEADEVTRLVTGEIASYRFSKRFDFGGGLVRWGDLQVSCLRDENGAPAFLMGQIVDVTKREVALRTLDATFATMLDPHALLDAVLDDHGTLVDAVFAKVNDAGLQYLQAAAEDVLGRRVSDVLAPEGAAEVIPWFAAAFARGSFALDEAPMRHSMYPGHQVLEIRAVRVDHSISFTWRNITARLRDAQEISEREAAYRLLADNITDVIIRSGADGRIEYVSPSVTATLGWQPEDLYGMSMADLICPDDMDTVLVAQGEAVASGSDEGRAIFRARTAGGGWRWVSDHGRIVRDAQGLFIGGVDSLRDAEIEHAASQARERHNAELRGIIDSLVDPWVQLTAVRDDAGTIVDFVYTDANEAACRHNHVQRSVLVGARLLQLLPEHESSGIFARYVSVVETGVSLAENDVPFTDPWDGHVGWFDNRAVKVGDGISLTWRDVSDSYRARLALTDQAEHDLLTGLANRHHLEKRLAQVVAGQRRMGTKVAVLYLDLDHFKEINDTFGHAVGDGVLTSVAARTRSAVRDADVVARLGGDEFVVVLDAVHSVQDARAIAEKVAVAIGAPVQVGAMTLEPEVSIGVAMVRAGDGPEEALAAADRAMYEAKRLGRNRVVVSGED